MLLPLEASLKPARLAKLQAIDCRRRGGHVPDWPLAAFVQSAPPTATQRVRVRTEF